MEKETLVFNSFAEMDAYFKGRLEIVEPIEVEETEDEDVSTNEDI